MSNFSEDNPDVAAAAADDRRPGVFTEPVSVFDSSTNEEAEMVRATLEAAGIPATISGATVNPYAGAIDAVDSAWGHSVLVSPSDAEAARAILAEGPMSEEELAAAEEADPTTLEEAEARARRA